MKFKQARIVALSVLNIKSEQGHFPDGFVEAMRNRGPTIRQGTKDSNLIFVNFPDHTRVLMRKLQAGEEPDLSEVVLE